MIVLRALHTAEAGSSSGSLSGAKGETGARPMAGTVVGAVEVAAIAAGTGAGIDWVDVGAEAVMARTGAGRGGIIGVRAGVVVVVVDVDEAGFKAVVTDVTPWSWPWRVRRASPVCASHTRTVSSPLPDTMHFPSGLYATDETALTWPWKVWRHDPALKMAGILITGRSCPTALAKNSDAGEWCMAAVTGTSVRYLVTEALSAGCCTHRFP